MSGMQVAGADGNVQYYTATLTAGRKRNEKAREGGHTDERSTETR